jgi:cell division protein FtsL
MTQALVSSYQIQFDKSINDLMTVFTSKQSRFKKIMRDVATYILTAICFIFVITFLYIFKLIKYKLEKEIKKLESSIEQRLTVLQKNCTVSYRISVRPVSIPYRTVPYRLKNLHTVPYRYRRGFAVYRLAKYRTAKFF